MVKRAARPAVANRSELLRGDVFRSMGCSRRAAKPIAVSRAGLGTAFGTTRVALQRLFKLPGTCEQKRFVIAQHAFHLQSFADAQRQAALRVRQ